MEGTVIKGGSIKPHHYWRKYNDQYLLIFIHQWFLHFRQEWAVLILLQKKSAVILSEFIPKNGRKYKGRYIWIFIRQWFLYFCPEWCTVLLGKTNPHTNSKKFPPPPKIWVHFQGGFITLTTMADNIVNVRTLIFITNGYYISGQSGGVLRGGGA